MTHAVAAVSISHALAPRSYLPTTSMLAAVAAMVPDTDVAAFRFGISYGGMWGHRGITHSLMFALMIGIAVWGYFGELPQRERLQLAACVALAAASHGMLDAFTNGGRGVAFFAPFDHTRFFFPYTPIDVSPIGWAFFSNRGVRVLLSEMRWVWFPALLLAIALHAIRRKPAGL